MLVSFAVGVHPKLLCATVQIKDVVLDICGLHPNSETKLPVFLFLFHMSLLELLMSPLQMALLSSSVSFSLSLAGVKKVGNWGVDSIPLNTRLP